MPLGGYVKIAGMIDESMDTEQMKQPAQPWEFRAKPAWQRLLIMLGGVLVNVLLAFVIYIGILFTWGRPIFLQKTSLTEWYATASSKISECETVILSLLSTIKKWSVLTMCFPKYCSIVPRPFRYCAMESKFLWIFRMTLLLRCWNYRPRVSS